MKTSVNKSYDLENSEHRPDQVYVISYSEKKGNKFTNGDVEENSKDMSNADFETAITEAGFGLFNYMVLLVALPACMTTVFETTSMSFVLPIAHCDIAMSLTDKGVVNAATYLGMITSAFFWGYLSDTLGRRSLLVWGFFVDAIFTVIVAFSQNMAMLLSLKFLTGFIINGPFAVLTTYMAEFHSTEYRSTVIIAGGIYFGLSNIIIPCFGWWILPMKLHLPLGDTEFHSWQVFLLVCSIPSMLSCIGYFLLPESPKFLMTIGKNEEALKILRKVYAMNTGNPPESYPVKQLEDELAKREEKIRQDGNAHVGKITANRSTLKALKEGFQQIVPLFFPPHLTGILLVCGIQGFNFMGLNTIRLWLPQLFTIIDEYTFAHNNEESSLCEMISIVQIPDSENVTIPDICTESEITDRVYINAIIIAITMVIGNSFTTCLVKTIGRKPVFVSMLTLSGSCVTAVYFAKDSLTVLILSAIFISASGICANLMLAFVVDLFPTTLRTMSVALTMMSGRSGAMIGNIIFPYLLLSGCLPPFLLMGGIILFAAVISLMLPSEKGKALE